MPSNPSGQADPSPPNRLNKTTFPHTSPSVGIRFSRNHIPRFTLEPTVLASTHPPPGPNIIASLTIGEKTPGGVSLESSCLIDMIIVSVWPTGEVRKS